MTKKIGIITYWESTDNYGQVLQCYALQQYLRKQGYKPFLIRFKRWQPTTKKLSKQIKQKIKHILRELLYTTQLANNEIIYNKLEKMLNLDKNVILRKFPQFKKKHLSLSNRVYSDFNSLKKSPPKADIYITGSDQVWNYDLTADELKAFFLQFGPTNISRIAYAPSIGHTSIPADILYEMKNYLSTFDAISVREKSAVDIIQSVGCKVEHVVDPTLLLGQDDYEKLIRDANVSAVPSVFIYSLNYGSTDDLPWVEVQQYAKEKQLPIVATPSCGYLTARELFDNVSYLYATIPQWLEQIRKSELVVTASFHGVVFAILMHRPFIFTPLKGKYATSNVRALSLLEALNLQQCIYNERFCIPTINWTEVDNGLTILRKQSLNFIKNSINEK